MRAGEGQNVDAVLVILALLAAIVGGLTMSQISAGVGILAGACLLAILARMVQAGRQHREMVSLLRQGLGMAPPVVATNRPGTWTCARCQYENGTGLFDCPHCGAARPTDQHA